MSDKLSSAQFPLGKLNSEDKGGVMVGIALDEGNVIIHFSEQLMWVGMPPHEATNFAHKIIEIAAKAQKAQH